jgi:predicted amidohydrolase YtcJ
VEIVRGAVAAAPSPDSWVRGQGWNDNRLPRPPDRRDIDPVSGDHPVSSPTSRSTRSRRTPPRCAWPGVTRDTVPPPGGVIEKDAAGEPTGVLRETAQGLVQRVVPPFTGTRSRAASTPASSSCTGTGITSVTEPGIDLATLAIYAEKAAAGRLGVRVSALLRGGTAPAHVRDILAAYRRSRGVDPKVLRVGRVKIFADGIPTAAKTAWLHQPYLDGSNGHLRHRRRDRGRAGREPAPDDRIAAAAGFQVGTHATGDATIDAVVAGYLKAMGRDRRRKDLRHYVIHGDLTPPATLRTMARHDIGVNMNGTIKFLLGRTLDPVLGPSGPTTSGRTAPRWTWACGCRAPRTRRSRCRTGSRA